MVTSRFDIWLVNLDPTVGSEMQKTRPCLIVSPDDLNLEIRTVIVAPLTSAGKIYSYRTACLFQRRNGWVALDQLRTVDKSRLQKRLGRIEVATQKAVLAILAEMFAE